MLKIMTLLLLMTAAGIKDLQTRRISNSLIALGIFNGIFLRLWFCEYHALLLSILGALAILSVGLIVVPVRLFGAADFKLLIMISMYVHPRSLLDICIYAILFGAVWSGLWMLYNDTALNRWEYLRRYIFNAWAHKKVLPYISDMNQHLFDQGMIPFAIPVFWGVLLEISIRGWVC